MTIHQKLTLTGVLALSAAVALWDVGLLLDDTPSNTISSVLQSQGWAAGALGFVSVHIVRAPHHKAVLRGWWATAAGGIVSLGAAQAVGGGVLGLALGAAVGWLTWSNGGRD